jgi:hypothetical protein
MAAERYPPRLEHVVARTAGHADLLHTMQHVVQDCVKSSVQLIFRRSSQRRKHTGQLLATYPDRQRTHLFIPGCRRATKEIRTRLRHGVRADVLTTDLSDRDSNSRPNSTPMPDEAPVITMVRFGAGVGRFARIPARLDTGRRALALRCVSDLVDARSGEFGRPEERDRSSPNEVTYCVLCSAPVYISGYHADHCGSADGPAHVEAEG